MKNFKSFTQKKLDKIELEFAQECKEKYEKLSLFFKSKRFSDILLKIKEQLKNNKTLSDNSYQEPLFNDVSNQEFISLFEILFNPNFFNLTKIEIVVEKNVPFYTEYVIYQRLKFLEIHGQGTAFFVEMAEDRGLDPQT